MTIALGVNTTGHRNPIFHIRIELYLLLYLILEFQEIGIQFPWGLYFSISSGL